MPHPLFTSSVGIQYDNHIRAIQQRSQLQAQRRHEQSLARIANPVRDRTLDGRSATPNSTRPQSSGSAGGPAASFSPVGPVSTLNNADRDGLGTGANNTKRPGVGSTLGFNPPPTQSQFQPQGASKLSSYLQNSRVR